MIDSNLTRAELDEAARLFAFYIDKIDAYAGWSYMCLVNAEDYRFRAGLFLGAYKDATEGDGSHFPVGATVYIDKDGDAYRLIADPAFSILGDAILMGPDPFVSADRRLWRLASKFSANRWDGEGDFL